jgi:hypothetical protein
MPIKIFESPSIQAFETPEMGMGVQGLPFRGISTALNPLPSIYFSAICMPSASDQ